MSNTTDKGVVTWLARRMARQAGEPTSEAELTMPKLMQPPPYTPVQAMTDILQGVAVTDPYRWLEDQESSQTRAWLAAQTRYARSYLDAIPERDQIRSRLHELLSGETHDSVRTVGGRYFFRKRLPNQEQPCIYYREKSNAQDRMLFDPAAHAGSKYTAAKMRCVSADGRLLLCEIKEGGEQTGRFEIIDVQHRTVLPDILPRGYLRGFAFAPDSRGFYYVHETLGVPDLRSRTAYRHLLGTSFDDDQQVFCADAAEKVQLQIVPGKKQLGFFVHRFLDKTQIDFYLWRMDRQDAPKRLIANAEYQFGPRLLDDGRILAITNLAAPSLRIIEVLSGNGEEAQFLDLVPASDALITGWAVTSAHICVCYVRGTQTAVDLFDLNGRRLGALPLDEGSTVRLMEASGDSDQLFFERESFTQPVQICCYSPQRGGQMQPWPKRQAHESSQHHDYTQVWYAAKDGTRIPMFLVGRREVLEGGAWPTVMTGYGGYGLSMTPRFSVLMTVLIEHGCLFAVPNIRGGAEFGVAWHDAAKRRAKHVAFDDFLCAAEWLLATGRTTPGKLAMLGASHAGLLVGAAMTQRPDLFCAAVCMVPILDMLRYHLFDTARLWREELGTSEDPEDFAALVDYSPYHRVRDGVAYPATLLVSGDADQNCNPLHARKMTARLQAASASANPVLLDYHPLRGHSPMLPLSERIEGLTDRLAFLFDQLGLTA